MPDMKYYDDLLKAEEAFKLDLRAAIAKVRVDHRRRMIDAGFAMDHVNETLDDIDYASLISKLPK